MTICLDDILELSPTVKQCMQDLHAVFEKLHPERLFAKLKKCFFAQTLVKYFAHIVEVGSLHVDPDKVAAIHTWPKPFMVKEL